MESYLLLVSEFDIHIVKTPMDIKLGKVLSSMELWNEFED